MRPSLPGVPELALRVRTQERDPFFGSISVNPARHVKTPSRSSVMPFVLMSSAHASSAFSKEA